MLIKHLNVMGFVALVAMLTALSSVAHAKLDVVTTTPALASVADAVGGQHTSVKALSLSTQDPHWVDARPNLALELAQADLLVLVGLDLEVGWLPALLTASRNGKIQPGGSGYLDASRLVSVLEVPKGKVDRSLGDVHPGGNPHYTYDPRRMRQVASGIAQKLSELDPDHRNDYSANAKAFNDKLDAWRQHWEKQLAQLAGKKVITYHKSLSYIADWLRFEVIAHLEPKPGIPPSPGHVAHVIKVGRSNHVRLLIQESYYPGKTSELVAAQIGARLSVIPGGPNFRAKESYIGFINQVVERLKASTTP